MQQLELTNRMKEIADFFKDLKDVHFVGGCIRDLILGIEPHDYDLITSAEPDEIISYIKSKGRRAYLTGKRYGTISCKVSIDNELIEITTFRKEIYDFESRKPKVEFTKFLEADLGRRDFTINAIACDLNGKIKDPLNGLEDLKLGILKCVGNPKIRFKEDPLRVLRGIRLSAKFYFDYDSKTKEKLEHCRWELYRISKERIIDELNKMLKLNASSVKFALTDLWNMKIWQVILPDMQLQHRYFQHNPHHDFDLHEHTIKVVLNVKREPILREDLPCIWAALLHDVGKPHVKEYRPEKDYSSYINHELVGADIANDFCRKYKFSNEDRELIVKYIKNHLKPDNWMKTMDDGGKKR